MSEFPLYKEQVLAEYDQKKNSDQLPSELIHTTPGNLKAEWQTLSEKNFDEKCEKLLRSFFGEKDDLSGYRKSLREEGADKCRPLSTFLRDRSIDTAERNIELLAYLINFQPRPYVTWLKDPDRHTRKKEPEITVTPPPIIVDPPVITNGTDPGEKKDGTKGPSTEDEGPGRPFWKKYGIFSALIIVALLAGGIYKYIIARDTDSTTGNPSASKTNALAALKKLPTGCMIWNKDHYEQVPCQLTGDGRLVLPLDSNKLLHLKQVTDTSTINRTSIGHIWYFKSPKGVECFTAPGPYPLDTNRRLLPITAYMIRKYFHW